MRHPSSKRYSKILRLRWKRKENEVYISNKNNPMNFLVLRTQKETGMILGITRQRVHQLERHAIYKIRQKMKNFL